MRNLNVLCFSIPFRKQQGWARRTCQQVRSKVKKLQLSRSKVSSARPASLLVRNKLCETLQILIERLKVKNNIILGFRKAIRVQQLLICLCLDNLQSNISKVINVWRKLIQDAKLSNSMTRKFQRWSFVVRSLQVYYGRIVIRLWVVKNCKARSNYPYRLGQR